MSRRRRARHLSAVRVTSASRSVRRQISGATIRISNCEEKDRECGNTDRTISITGAPDNVSLAVYLINLRSGRFLWQCAPPPSPSAYSHPPTVLWCAVLPSAPSS